MKREMMLATLVLSIALPTAMAQTSQKPNTPNTPNGPNGHAGTELIAWTQVQKPEPVPSPQPVPLRKQQPEPRPETQPPNQPAEHQYDAQKEPATQAFSGTIMKAGDKYVLKTADNMTYQLDDQQRARKFEGKQVQVTGTLDTDSTMIKVQEIKTAA
jgi:hypothetical protein